MTWTILIQRSDGDWTDYIGSAPNEWPSPEAANEAISALQASGLTGPWAIVETSTLSSRDLVT